MARRHAQLVYETADRAFTERCKSLLTNASNPRKWLSIVKIAVFGASCCLSFLVCRGDKLAWSANEMASLFLRTLTLSSAEIGFTAAFLLFFSGTLFCCLPV